MSIPDPYRVACLQLRLLGPVETAVDAESYHERALEHLDRTLTAVARLKRQAELRLVLVPEFFLCGAPGSLEIGGVAIPGQLSADLGRLAREHGVFIAANLVENASPAFYDSCVLLDDTGELVLHYREVASAAHVRSPMVGPPLERLENETDAAVVDRIMPTADTALGRIGLLVGSDIRYGSLAALTRTNGADVIVHVANESEMCRDVWSLAKVARARETGCWLVSCNNAGYADPLHSVGQTTWGGSRVLDPHGRALAMTLSTGEAVVDATVDVSLARALRDRPGATPLGVLSVERSAPRATEPGAFAAPFHPTVRAAYGPVDGADVVEDRFELELAGPAGGTLVVAERLDAAGKGTRSFDLGGQDVTEEIDCLAAGVVTVVGIGAVGGLPTWTGAARVEVGRGADAVRRLAADGAALALVVTDADETDGAWQELLDWARVAAWETEVHTLLLGNRIVRRTPLARGAAARSRVLAQVSPMGELLEVTELGEQPWTSLPFPLVTSPSDVELLTQRRLVRQQLAALGDSLLAAVRH